MYFIFDLKIFSKTRKDILPISLRNIKSRTIVTQIRLLYNGPALFQAIFTF